MSSKKKVTPARRKRASEARHAAADAVTAADLLAAAYPDEGARSDAECGIWTRGSVLDAACDLAEELDVTIFHPEVFPAVLKVILREGQPVAAERVTNFRKWLAENPGRPRPWLIRDYLRRMQRAARKGK